MSEFFRVTTAEQVIEALASFHRLGKEHTGLNSLLSRVSAEDVVSPENLPPASRSTMDGFALRARDTFGASDSLPALLEVVGSVEMGELPGFGIGPGEAVRIPTGGFLPKGADAVVMVEYTSFLDGTTLEVARPVTAGENVLAAGEDVAQGQVVLKAGARVTAQDIGLLAALGITEIPVYRRPRVAIVSTGDEVVDVNESPGPGQVRDVNSHAVAAMVSELGGLAVPFGLVPDDRKSLKQAMERGLEEGDLLVLSGGSSVGERDLMVEVAGSLEGAEIIAHGVAVSPGKPTLFARVGKKPLICLPGHPVSAMVVALVFLAPFVRFLMGEEMKKGPLGPRVKARLTTSVPSVQGREDFVRVKLAKEGGEILATPLFGKSGAVSLMARARGLISVPTHAEGLAGGEEVEAFLLKDSYL